MVLPALLSLAVLMKPTEFPKDFIGDWRGTMEWSKPGESKPQTVAMRLRIEKTPEADTYTYQLSYGDKGQDDRPYLLKAVDAAKGHWRVDERNGIELDGYWVGGSFVSVFTVSGNTIVTRERREGNALISEMTTYDSATSTKTGDRGPEIPPVTTQRIKSLQRAVLRRSGPLTR